MGLIALELSGYMNGSVYPRIGNDLFAGREAMYVADFRQYNGAVNGSDARKGADLRIHLRHISLDLLVDESDPFFDEIKLFQHLTYLKNEAVQRHTQADGEFSRGLYLHCLRRPKTSLRGFGE